MILVLLTSSFAFAEGDYEEGSGWKYQNGVLTITANGGFEAYFKEVDDYDRAKKYQNEPYQIDCIVIGKNVTQFSMFAFGTDFYPSQMIVEEGNPNFSVVDGWLVNVKTKTLICATDLYHFQWMSSARNIPDSVQYIGENAFYPLNNIQQICLPDNIIAIEDNAFESCEALQTIELPSNVKKIGRSAFNYCHSLKKVSLDTSVDTIGEYAFYSCYNLVTINLEDTQITELNSNALSMAGIKSIVLPDTLQAIKSYAFELCWFLETITVCSDNIVIFDGAFSKCDALKTIIFTKGVPKWIGSRLFDETGKTADGKSFISSSYEAEGKVIPYPTLYYTAAYADEWAPNGETVWNGYPIDELSQDELNAILAEARGEPVPTPTATAAATASPAATQAVVAAIFRTPFIVLLLAGLIALAIAAIVVVGVLRRHKQIKR